MEPLLWLLLPVAAASGWFTAKLSAFRQQAAEKENHRQNQNIIRGLNYFLSQDSDKAINSLVSSLEVNDDTVETHLILGSIFRDRGEIDRAIRIHQNIIARPELSSSQKNHAMLQLGLDFFRSGLLDRAEHILLQLSAQDSKNPRVYDYLCRLFEQENDWEKVIEYAKKLVRYDPGDQSKRLAHYYCEWVEELGLGHPQFSLKLTKEALAVDPACTRAWLQTGDLLSRLGKKKQAKKAYLEALERDPHFSPVIITQIYKLFEHHNELNEFPDFIHHYLNIEADPAARFFLITCLQRLGQHERVDDMLANELHRTVSSPHIVKKYLDVMTSRTKGDIKTSFVALSRVLEARIGTYMACHCSQCGFEANDLFWQCPGCKSWGSVQPYENPMEYNWLE